jgi:hypothetical protein
MADITINPITGEPLGGAPTLDSKTNLPNNPITGKPMGTYGGTNNLTIGGNNKNLIPNMIHGSQFTTNRGEDINRYLKYDVPLGQNLDWDEIRARNQSTAEKWGHGLSKAGITTLGAVAENTLGIVAGLGELATGGAYYDNVIGKAVDRTNEWMQEYMPNYRTQNEQSMGTLAKMGTANFWADTVANGLGYSLGSIATMWLTGGGGLLTKGISGAAKGLGIYNATKSIINGTRLASILGGGGVLTARGFGSALNLLEGAAMMSLAEASVESRETQRSTYDGMVNKWLAENVGYEKSDIPPELLADFENTSYSAANSNFAIQMPVLMGTNILMFGRQITGFRGAVNATKDVIYNEAKRKAVSSLTGKTLLGKTLSKIKPTVGVMLSESAQEGLQFASNIFSNTYYTDKYYNGGVGDMAHALSKSLSETFGTQEGRESMLVGALVGGFSGGATNIGAYKNRVEQANTLADIINSGVLDNTHKRVLTAQASAAVVNRMDEHAKNGDIKKFKDEQFKLIQYQTLEALERGGFDVMMEKLNDSKTLSDQEFMKALGYKTENTKGEKLTLESQTGGKSKETVIDGIVKKLQNFKQVYERVNSKFPLPDKASGAVRMMMSEDQRVAEDLVYEDQRRLRDELILTGTNIQERNRRMQSIQDNMQETTKEAESFIGGLKAPIGKLGIIQGPQESPNDVLQEQSPDHIGEVDPASKYNPVTQYNNALERLKDITKRVKAIDPILGQDIENNAADYLDLLRENNTALDRYNKLASDQYFQETEKRAIKAAEDIAAQEARNTAAQELIDNAKTSSEFIDNPNIQNVDPIIRAKLKAKYEDLRKKEAQATRKFLDSKLTDQELLNKLKKLSKKDLSPTEVEGLKGAINALEKKLEGTDVTQEEKDNQEFESKDLGEVEKELTPEETEGVVEVSEDGRSFIITKAVKGENISWEDAKNIDSKTRFKLYNKMLNPLDAIVRNRAGDIKKIRLVDENGNKETIWGPQARVDAIAYAILMSEQLKIDSKEVIIQDDVIKEKEALEEESKELLGKKGVHGAKQSESLRTEIYELERLLDGLVETYDNLRTSYIKDAGATKSDLANDPQLKELKTLTRSATSKIAARRRILKLRGEELQATSSEILKIERTAIQAISELEDTLKSTKSNLDSINKDLETLDTLMGNAKASDDLDTFKELSKEKKTLIELQEEDNIKIENIEKSINTNNRKLKRLENERTNVAARAAEQVEQRSTEGVTGEDSSTENPITGKESQEEKTTITLAESLGYTRVRGDKYYRYDPPTKTYLEIDDSSIESEDKNEETGIEYVVIKDETGRFFIVDILTGTPLIASEDTKGKAINTLLKRVKNDGLPARVENILSAREPSPLYDKTEEVPEGPTSSIHEATKKSNEKEDTRKSTEHKKSVNTPKIVTPGNVVPTTKESDVTQLDMFDKGRGDNFLSDVPTAPVAPTIAKEGVSEVFKKNSELSEIGTEEQYSAYLDTVFPSSKVEGIKYHGTQREFEKFKSGVSKVSPGTTATDLFWFTTRVSAGMYAGEQIDWSSFTAEEIAEGKKAMLEKGMTTSRVIPSVLKSTNPFDYENPEHLKSMDEMIKSRKDYVIGDIESYRNVIKKEGNWYRIEKLIPQIKKAGFDGVYALERDDAGNLSKDIAVFSPKQIQILGSKQDIKGFKKFVSKPVAPVAPVKNGQDIYTKNIKDVNDIKKYQEIQNLVDLGQKLDNDKSLLGAGWRVSRDFGNIGKRPVVEITTSNGDTFLMYRSSGKGTGLASRGKWVALPGFAKDGWFIKTGYDSINNKVLTDEEFSERGRKDEENPKFNHYGSRIFAKIAEELGSKGVKVTATKGGDIVEKVSLPKKTKSKMGLVAASEENVVETVDRNGKVKFKVPVGESGKPIHRARNTINGEEIILNKDLLTISPPGTPVEFELVQNDWFINNFTELNENNWTTVPIYYKIQGERVGLLERVHPTKDPKLAAERKALVNILSNGGTAVSTIDAIRSSNFNHSITEEGDIYFSNPEDVFGPGEVTLAFVEVATTDGMQVPKWIIPESNSEFKEFESDQIEHDIASSDVGAVNPGQVAFVIKPKNNPGRIARIAMASTSNLTSTAQTAVLTALKEKDMGTASEIVANSELIDTAEDNPYFLKFDMFADGTNFLVYNSKSTGNLIRINETELSAILSGKKGKFGFVNVADGDNFVAANVNINKNDVDIKGEFTEFLKSKKYHVSRVLGNMEGEYKSKVTGTTYNTYQEYLFSPSEVTGERIKGKGYNSIVATDLVRLGNSLFVNPEVTFTQPSKTTEEGIKTLDTIKQDSKQMSTEDVDNITSMLGGSSFTTPTTLEIKKESLKDDSKDCN